MTSARLEHINITVPDPQASAAILCDLFDWHIRWEGAVMNDGYSVHVGSAQDYLALYRPGAGLRPAQPRYVTAASLAHVGVVVDDLDAAEAKVRAAGYTPHNHGDYEPGRRFYFDGPDGVEFEIVAYD